MAKASDRVILVGVDDSNFAENAFLYYVENISKPDDYIVFVHIPEHQDLAASKAPGVEHLLREVQQKARQIQTAYMAKLDRMRLHGRFHIGTGTKPGEAILKVAKEIDATLIVTGSRGHSKIRRAFLGSCSDYIIHNSHVPILVYRVNEF